MLPSKSQRVWIGLPSSYRRKEGGIKEPMGICSEFEAPRSLLHGLRVRQTVALGICKCSFVTSMKAVTSQAS